MSYDPYSCTASADEELAEELIQKISGSFSILGSTYIAVDVVRKLIVEKETRTDPYQRVMLGLSFFDLITSFFDSFMGTWMTPAETGWLNAAGNQASCTAQGFFTAFGFMGSFGYQMALSLNILFLIAFGWSQNKFARTVEKPMHLFIILAALAYAIAPLPLESYNPSCGQCLWDVIYDECDDDPEEVCVVRGSENLRDQYWEVFWAMLWTMLAVCTIAMIWVYVSVRRLENKMKRYRYEDENHRESKRIRKILFLYTLALYLCWGIPFTLIFVSIKVDAWPSKIPFGIRALCEALIPLTGFFNMLVYFLPKCLKYQREHSGTCLVVAYFHVLIPSSACCCCCCCGKSASEEENRTDSNTNFNKVNRSSRLTGRFSSRMNFAKFNLSGSLRRSTMAKTSLATSSVPVSETGGGDIEEDNAGVPEENAEQH